MRGTAGLATRPLAELAHELKRLDRSRRRRGLPLSEAQQWQALHAEILRRLAGTDAGDSGLMRVDAERRDVLRIPCASQTQIGNARGGWLAKNFSPGGIGVQGNPLPAAGTSLALEWLRVGDEQLPFELQAQVIWSRRGEAGLSLARREGAQPMIEALYATLLAAFLEEE